MTALPSTGGQAADYLRDHLAPDLYAQLRHTGSLPIELVRAECARLRAELGAIATYIPARLLREQLSAPMPGRVHGAYWDGSVLFADLSGFTRLSGALSALGKQGAEEVSALINLLFGALVEEIHRYSGGLFKFGGDAITAFFDASTLGVQHANLASHAALAMQQRMAEFAALSTRAGTFTLSLRIGVHSGTVFAAQVGDSEHIELVVTGRNINRVALAQEIAEPGEVVISGSTRKLLADVQVDLRQSNFFVLHTLPDITLPPSADRGFWTTGSEDLVELHGLAMRVAALRPYLPRGLPRRFLAPEQTEDTVREAGEFRPVTVLFANFYPFSVVLDMLGDDCDTAVGVLNAYYRRAQEVVHRYGGIVNKVDMYTFGDKLMALFGAPVAHEDDPLRAARAALELRTVLLDANQEIFSLLQPKIGHLIKIEPDFLKQRVGLNTGVVFAGQVGAAHRHEYTVMGPHVNLAARLMSAAGESDIIVSPATRRVIERHIALERLEPVKLKGIDEPVPIARALHAFEIVQADRRGVARPSLVGRTHELEQMTDQARQALARHGRVLALVGEAGTGKTRLIEDALQRLILLSADSDQGVEVFFPYSVECQSYEQNTPYAVVRELMREFFNLNAANNTNLSNQFALVNQRVSDLTPDLQRFAPLLGDILGLVFDETPLIAALTPEQRHDRAQELIEALILAEARVRPLVLIIDDLHWADASSMDLLSRVAQSAPQAPLLLLLSYRLDPPIPEPWRQLEHCLFLQVRELQPEGSLALMRALLRGEPPPELITLIDRTQGNPFFVEEVVRGLVESGALVRTEQGWQLTHELDNAIVPDSIEGVITARLDRLEDRNREVLQVAAVVGRRFPYTLLSGVIARSRELRSSLQQLAAVDLILPEELERELSYVFRQALTRDVAYESILYARRRELHLRVARQIETLQADRIDDQLALLARHYLLAEAWAPAFHYHLRAGRQAQARYANREAITLYEQALRIVPRFAAEQGSSATSQGSISDSFKWLALIIELHERLGVVLALIAEYDAALQQYQTALTLLGQQATATLDELLRLHHHIARVYGARGDFETAQEWVERALTQAGQIQSQELARCLDLGAGIFQRQGRNSQAIEWGERALQIAEQLGSLRLQASALKRLGGTYRNMGDNRRALELMSRCLHIYEQIQELPGLADAHNDLANTYFELGQLAQARTHYEAGAEIKAAVGDINGQGMIANNLGEVFRLQDQLDSAIEQYQRGLAIYERIGSPYMTGVLNMNLGATYLLREELDTATIHLQRSAELFAQAGAEDFLAELERYVAELHLRRGNLILARQACELSLVHAARLEARAEAGMTHRTLGQICKREGDVSAAWEQFTLSLQILHETANQYESARTLIALAALATQVGQHEQGQLALDQALPILTSMEARRDIAEARAVAQQYGYRIGSHSE